MTTLPTFEPPVAPSPGTTFKPKVKVLETEFGDGYTQSTPNGLNNIREHAQFRWNGLELWQMQAIIGFFEARKGAEVFYYRPAGYADPLKWTCKEWEKTFDNGVWKITASFVQSFTSVV